MNTVENNTKNLLAWKVKDLKSHKLMFGDRNKIIFENTCEMNWDDYLHMFGCHYQNINTHSWFPMEDRKIISVNTDKNKVILKMLENN